MHLSRDAQKRRLKKLEKDPLTSWRVTQQDWDHWHIYDRFEGAAERTIMRTSTGTAPWTIVEGVDPCFRSLTIGEIVRDEITTHLDETRRKKMLLEELATERRSDSVEQKPEDEPTAEDGSPDCIPPEEGHGAVRSGHVAAFVQTRLQEKVAGMPGAAEPAASQGTQGRRSRPS